MIWSLTQYISGSLPFLFPKASNWRDFVTFHFLSQNLLSPVHCFFHAITGSTIEIIKSDISLCTDDEIIYKYHYGSTYERLGSKKC